MSMKILLISDDMKLEKKLQAHIKDHTFTISHEKSGLSAISKIKSYKPQIVMLDIETPKKDGWEILKEMQESKALAKIPAIIVDSRNSHKHEIAAFESGAAAYTSKSSPSELLLQKLYSIQVLTEIQSRHSKPIIDANKV